MKILYVGGGFVGACSAVVSADSGHDVLVYDINSELIRKLGSLDKDMIESCIFERGLGDLIIRNQTRIKFTDDISMLKSFLQDAEAIFMCLPTPEKDGTGETNLAFYEKAASELAEIMADRNEGEQRNYILIINKSTVPIDMVNRTDEIMKQYGVKNYGIGSNPEFLVEGIAIEGSIRPPRVVVGAWHEEDFMIFRKIYKRFYESPTVEYIEVNPMEAAAGKLLANYMLFTRLANCFDVMGRTCEKFSHLHFENLRKILITDSRIGEWGFYDSLFAGGSCFIKDARSLSHQLKAKGAETDLVDDALKANYRQLNGFISRAKEELGFSWSGKKVGLLGLAFKRHTNDMRNSPALTITSTLLDEGAEMINGFDPVAGDNYMKLMSEHHDFSKINLVSDELSAIKDMDVIIIAADWPQFSELSEMIKANLKPGGLIMDGRRMLHREYEELAGGGFYVIAVGSPIIKAKKI
jgi:UDPglucose 6-dehydrogenase